uniref:Methyltransferase type 12 domain-containing protein n=1 Tax=Amphora coffeiformis TaxID=265554 RepID=A0A7S3KWB0_9STRA
MSPQPTPSLETFETEEEPLRTLIEHRPKNGRAMAMLACLLEKQAKRKDGVVDEDPHCITAAILRQEALEWAHRSVQVAPEKPFGYMALSVLEDDYTKRIHALRKALRYQTFDDSSFARLSLLIRLLLEPKQHEARQVAGKIGKASKIHPSKRILSIEEENLYARIAKGLDGFWTQKSESLDVNVQDIALQEYRLGLFFRKRFPLETNQLRAKRHFQKAIEILPEHHDSLAAAEFWLGTLGDGKSVDRCPASYIVNLYSTFANNFDDLLLDKLKYQTPTVLRKLLDDCLISHDRHHDQQFARGLDLGCGTGLSGLAFRDKIQGALIGVDLSPEMIAKAKERQCYDVLQVGDVTTFLTSQPKEALPFDLIFACDVFVYLGDLSRIFASVHNTLSKNGIFAFSTELLEDKHDGTDDYILHPCARFAHSRNYIERLANSTIMPFNIIKLLTRSIRKNQGKDVIGLLAILEKID